MAVYEVVEHQTIWEIFAPSRTQEKVLRICTSLEEARTVMNSTVDSFKEKWHARFTINEDRDDNSVTLKCVNDTANNTYWFLVRKVESYEIWRTTYRPSSYWPYEFDKRPKRVKKNLADRATAERLAEHMQRRRKIRRVIRTRQARYDVRVVEPEVQADARNEGR